MADKLPAVLALLDRLQPAVQQRDRAEQVEIVRQLIEQRAPMGVQWQQIAYLAMGNGEHRLARAAIDLLVEALGGGAAAQYQKAALLALLGDWQAADSLLRTLPETVPDSASNAYSRGVAALNCGRREEAREALDRATRLRPQSGTPWLVLAMAVDFAREPALADRLIAAEREVRDAPPAEQVPYYYALGKAYTECGEHAQSFNAFSRGARLMKSSLVYDYDGDRSSAERAIDGYTAERLAAVAREQRQPTGRTIFVTGLPRSGTTLVEQILTSHSAVAGGGESSRLFLLANEVGGQSHAALAHYAEIHGVERLPLLWDHWLDELFEMPGRIVDKTVDTSRFLGLAAALLPEAPVIWMTRDPLDCAWSCFRTNFAGSAMPWSYDLADIAAHFRIEAGLLAQWREILGERLLVVPYESLVTEPDVWIRRILAHCGLAEEPQVFAPHENSRPVPTASMVQVRRPIHREAVGSAESYRSFLESFLEAYHG